MSQEKSISLFFTEGGSDKVYKAQLAERPDGWAVTFQYGRRGKSLTGGEKGSGLSYEKAAKIYDKIVSEKTSKGYTPNEDGAVFAGTEMAGRDTGFRPQLLNEISLEDVDRLGAEWFIGQKHDGERRTLIAGPDGLRFANKKGLEVGVQQVIADAFARLAAIHGDLLNADGEDMGDHLVIFDLPPTTRFNPGRPFVSRVEDLKALAKQIDSLGLSDILRVEIPLRAPEFFAQDGLTKLQKAKAEGIVCIHEDSAYKAGKPTSGGNALKAKFWKDLSVRVAPGRDGKRSVGMELLDDNGAWQSVGNVTIPANADIPPTGQIIDVKYLYAYKGGSLFQPTFKAVRNDVDPEECRMDRLQYVAGTDDPAPEVGDDLAPGM